MMVIGHDTSSISNSTQPKLDKSYFKPQENLVSLHERHQWRMTLQEFDSKVLNVKANLNLMLNRAHRWNTNFSKPRERIIQSLRNCID